MGPIPNETTLLLLSANEVYANHRPLRVRYAQDELISQGGTFAAGLYLIRRGLVDESIQDPRIASDIAQHNLLSTNDFIGLEVFLNPKEDLYQTSCRALTDTELLFIERTALYNALAQDLRLHRHVLAALAGRHFALQRSSWRQSAPPRERLRSLLLDIVASIGEQDLSGDGSCRLPAVLSQRILAQLANLSPRQLRRTCEMLDGVQWNQDGTLCVTPERLLEGAECARGAIAFPS